MEFKELSDTDTQNSFHFFPFIYMNKTSQLTSTKMKKEQ